MPLTTPPGLDLDETQQPMLYGVFVSTFVLAVIFVGLRVVCRRVLSKAGMWWDDWMIISSLAITTGNFAVMMLSVHQGLGTHVYKWGSQALVDFLINLFTIEILYALSICLTKYSILYFYVRIFGDSIRLSAYILAGVITSWGLAVILTTIFECVPVRAFWDKSITDAVCNVNVPHFFVACAVPNVLTDWALLLLPIPFIWRLHRDTSQKLALCGVFLLGGFICIISIVRFIIVLSALKVPSIDETWIFVSPSTWTAIEVNIGIVSACLPSMRPLLMAMNGKVHTVASTCNAGSNYADGQTSHGTWNRSRRSYYNGAENLVSTDDLSEHDMQAINLETRNDLENARREST